MTGWERDAACRTMPVDIWFPSRQTENASGGLAAKAVCATCPVARPCLEEALERREEHGIWAGAGESQRRWLAPIYRRRHEDPDGWETAVAQHLEMLGRLVTISRPPVSGRVRDRNGPGATHGQRPTYNRGCRCGPCMLAVRFDVAAAATRSRKSRTA